MRIAVVGTGIAGLGAAYVLSRAHEVELFERNGYAGGHTHTVSVGGLALDTGFIVHNEPNYPNLVRLFRELGVRTQDSDMSFSVSCGRCRLEYSARRPPVGGLLVEILRWLRTARRELERGDHEHSTLERFVAEQGYSCRFRDHFLVPLTSALWSTAPERALETPAAYAIHFFSNHGMLGLRRLAWKTVADGSRTYVRAIADRFGDRLHLGTEVRAVARAGEGVELRTADGEARRFDKVVIATHADQALRLLADPSEDELRTLGAFRYTANETVLHTDEALLPRRRASRASWNFQLADCAAQNGRPTITYYLSRLQRLDEDRHYCVTLNRTDEIAEEQVLERIAYEHPLYTFESLRAQERLPALSGRRHTYYAGAYHGNGFHEDGLASGIRAAAELGVRW